MRLSVVVTIVDGGDALRRCLTSLTSQTNPPELEIIVPWDETAADASGIAGQFGGVRAVALGRLTLDRDPQSWLGQHELFDRRRAAGLTAATGELVAIVEDRSVPRPDWAGAFVSAHNRLSAVAIGGGIDNGHHGTLNWAVFFCDFGRYRPPFTPGPRRWISDVNICYKRRALEMTRAAWRDRYHETTVHWALTSAGETLYLSDAPSVDQMRGPLRLGSLIRERFAWGRVFAYTRARERSVGARLLYAMATPVLPALLYARQVARQVKQPGFGTFLRATPAMLVLLTAWSLGEFAGYVTGRA